MKNIKYILILLIVILSIYNVSALTPSLISIEKVNKEDSFNFSNVVYAEFRTVENSDKITKIKIFMNDAGINSGVKLNFGAGNITYSALTSNFNYMGIIPYKNATHFLIYSNETNNYSFFKESKNYNTVIALNSEIIYEYSIVNGYTTISFSPNGNYINILKNTSNAYLGLPTSNFTIKSLTPVRIEIDVKDVDKIFFLKNKKESLNIVSQYIYGILTLNQAFGENEPLLYILVILDIFFTFIIVFIAIIFIYPYLILVWILTIGNIISSYKANTTKQFILYIREYYAMISELAMKVYRNVVVIILFIIRTLRAMVQL